MSASRISSNIAANFFAKAFGSLAVLLFTPFYISHLGMERYGLIGVYNSLLIIFSIFDFGLGTTLNRHLAQNISSQDPKKSCKNMLLSIEAIYFGVSVALGILAFFASSNAHLWFKTNDISRSELQYSVLFMSISTLLMWPITLYSNGLKGLQSQVSDSIILTLATAMRHFGGAAIILIFPAQGAIFFGWQLIVNSLFLLTFRLRLWGLLREKALNLKEKFSFSTLKENLGFSGQVFALGLLSLLVSQYDKIALSKFMPLKDFACFSLATTLAAGLSACLCSPIQSAFFPAFSKALSEKDPAKVNKLNRAYLDILGIIFIPVCIFSLVFSKHLIPVYMSNLASAKLVIKIFQLFIIGTCLNGMAQVSYSLFLAAGKARILIYLNALLALILIPTATMLFERYESLPASIGWIGFNVVCLLVLSFAAHRQILKMPFIASFVQKVIKPCIISLIFVFIGCQLGSSSTFLLVLQYALLGLACSTCIFLMSELRTDVLRRFGFLVKTKT